MPDVDGGLLMMKYPSQIGGGIALVGLDERYCWY